MGNETYYKLRKSDNSDSIQLEEVVETESPELEKVKMSVSNKALIASIVAVVLFTILCFVLEFSMGIEPSPTLTECWYRFWTCEIISLCSIKLVKVYKNYDKNEPVKNEEGAEE